MSFSINRISVFNALSAICAQVDNNSAPTQPSSQLIVYSGLRPTHMSDPITSQTALITYALPRPAFAVTNGTSPNDDAIATLNPVDPVISTATGTASFFRIINANGNVVIEGDVSDTTGNGDLKISTTNILTGFSVKIQSLVITLPSSQTP